MINEELMHVRGGMIQEPSICLQEDDQEHTKRTQWTINLLFCMKTVGWQEQSLGMVLCRGWRQMDLHSVLGLVLTLKIKIHSPNPRGMGWILSLLHSQRQHSVCNCHNNYLNEFSITKSECQRYNDDVLLLRIINGYLGSLTSLTTPCLLLQTRA